MKPKIKKIIIIILIIILLIPIQNRLKDGGSVEYKTLFYKYTKIHRLSEQSSTGYEDGWELKILGKKVGGVTNISVTACSIKLNKKELLDDSTFNKYLERDERTIYLASNIEEITYYKGYEKITLKNYIEKSWQTTDDGIQELTEQMENTATLRDGGTKIYKQKSCDITIITCNTLSGNKDIYIGDYNMEYNSSMCK